MGDHSTEVNLTNSFLNKVTAERRVLAIVNARYAGVRQLAGLSGAAIARWRVAVSNSGTDRLAEILTRLGVICQSLSNRSNESFDVLSSNVQGVIEAALNELRVAISEVAQ